MKKNACFIIACLFFIFCSVAITAQKPNLAALKTTKEKITAWLSYCESLKPHKGWMPAATGTETLQQAAIEGLKLTDKDDATDRSKFLAYEAQGFYYQQDIQSDSVGYYYRLSLQEANKAKDASLILSDCIALMHIGFEMQEQSTVDSFKNTVQSIIDTTTDKVMLHDGYAALGSYYQQKSYYSTAADYFIKSLQITKKQLDTAKDDAVKIAYANQCYNLAKLFVHAGAPEKSLEILRQGSPYKNIFSLTDVRYASSFIEVFCAMDKIDSALSYLHNTINPLEQQFQTRPGVPAEVVFANLSIAKYYIDRKKYDSSFSYLQKGYDLSIKSNEPVFKYHGQALMARYLVETGTPQKAIPLLTEAMPVAKQFSKEDYADMLKNMAMAKQQTGDAVNAVAYYKEYTGLLDTLSKEKISRNFADLETHYQTAEKEQQINSLDKENRLKLLELQNASHTKWMLVAGLIALGFIALLLYFIYRNKENLNNLLNKQNDQLAVANQTKARLFGIIGHDLRAPVGQIVNLLRLQKEHAGLLSEESKQMHEARIRTASENVLQTMEDLLLWSKSQMEYFTPQLTDVNIAELIKKETDLLTEQASGKQLRFVLATDNPFIKKTDTHFLAVILRNLLQNAVKYADAGTAVVIKNDASHLYITNHVLMSDADALNALLQNKQVDSREAGLGLQIAAELANAIDVDISFAGTQNKTITASLYWKA